MTLLSRRRLLLGAGALWALDPALAYADDPPVTLPLTFVVARENGEPVQGDEWLGQQLREVERIYGPLGIHFTVTPPRPGLAGAAHVETRQDRDALAADCTRKVVNVFVVASLRDVDDGVSPRRGVHWRNRHDASRRYIILSAIAGPSVLAHELGHYFGRGHSTVTDNLMSYDRTGAEVFLDTQQIATIRAAVRAIVRSGEVVPFTGPARDGGA